MRKNRHNVKKRSVAGTIVRVLLALALALIAVIIICNGLITKASKSRCYEDLDSIPHNKAALVLGTSSYLVNGGANPYFTYRIQAAADLYRAGKVDFLVVSGDNRHTSYNEPRAMKRALVAAGVPENVIYMDYAGFRTLDSVVRMNTIFSQESFTVVSQRFHIERAVYIARVRGLNAVGFAARDVSRRSGLKTRARESLARVKTFIDIFTHKEPHFGGEKIEIE